MHQNTIIKTKDDSYYEKKLEEAKKQQQISLIRRTNVWISNDLLDKEQEEMVVLCLMAKITETELEPLERKLCPSNLDLEN
ncbi:hypothetical protein HanIR_Chr10g0473511 [Helianthus annuus]|nr:hypothetical protein HanIR_Chr10g0473511 [Helianthus annuus]